MSMLSGARFAANDPDGSGPPKPIRIARVLLWIQGVLGVLLGAFTLVDTYRQQQLSDSELAKLLKQRFGEKAYNKQFADNPPTQELIPYTQIYLLSALLLVLTAALIWCALNVKHPRKGVRTITIAAEALFLVFSLWQLAAIGCVLIIPGIGVVVLLLSRRAGEWYAPAKES